MTDLAETPQHPTHPRWLLPLLGTGIATLLIAANIGNVVWVRWVNPIDGHPLWLLALNSSNRYLLITSIITSWPPYVAIAMARLLAPDPLFYILGYAYRGRALGWARNVFPGMDGIFDQFEQDRSGFKRILDVAVVVAPNNPVCLLAGVAAMPIRRFIALNVIGTLGRILIMRGLGLLFEEQIQHLLEIVGRYQRFFTLGSLALVAGYLIYQTVGKRGVVGGLETLEEELGED
ncbi:unannotated protein [freshwater metagenome]|uniref:Unannotated protein n=1 Tax=freshwater metagenome TaxID=449393 RepID=A0A6J7FN58_9ZZZZ|nr:hypothetical protein [Actinomycetota bacterium]MSY79440.1 hypothetical protein [Actinomycetota bacterium]MTA64377.1 hypothetical protein [Actinomycetota bacterium]